MVIGFYEYNMLVFVQQAVTKVDAKRQSTRNILCLIVYKRSLAYMLPEAYNLNTDVQRSYVSTICKILNLDRNKSSKRLIKNA